MSILRYVNLRSSVFIKAAVMFMAAGILFTTAHNAGAAGKTRIVVVPFTVNAVDNLDFLQRGISEMLVSRLGWEDKVVAISAGKPGDAIGPLAKQNRADYVVTGSLTVLGTRVSTDSRVFKGTDVTTPVLSYGRTGGQQSDIIDHIDGLAGEINGRLLGRGKPLEKKTETTVPVVPVPAPAVGLERDTPSVQPPRTDSGIGHPMATATTVRELVPLRLTGMGEFNVQLTGLAAGDVDGDGAADIVAISSSRLYVYGLNQGRWVKTTEFKGVGDFIGVDTADLNGNGRQEIFVTSFDNAVGQVNSFVMEWDGGSLKRIAGNLSIYFRAVDIAERGKVLVGQRQGLGVRFGPTIHEMVWQAGSYEFGERIPVPRKLNIFGFAYGAVRSTDNREAVAYDSSGYVKILKRSGSEALVTTDQYGGGSNFVVFTDEDQYDVQDYIFLSPRIHLHDLDSDGVQEMLVIHNEYKYGTGGALERHRIYSKGSLVWLGWYGEGIRPIMRTLDVPRFISDSALVDLDGDGSLEIVAAVVRKTASALSKGSSVLTVYKLDSVGKGS